MNAMRIGGLAALLWWLGAAWAAASGVLVPRDGSPPIAVRSHRVEAVVKDGLARTTVRQTFVNPHGRVLEAVYLFPLPEGASLTGLALETGGQRLEGLLAERQTARRSYDAIVRRELDPALVEQIGRSKFRLSVFPVLPDQPTVVELSWVEVVPLRDGELRYVYPLALGETASRTEADLTVSVTIESSAPLQSIRGEDEDVAAELVSPHEGRASLERSQALLSEDVVVCARVAAPEPQIAVRTYRAPDGDPYFAAVITPPPLRPEQALPRDVSLVLDVSGSMQGVKIQQAKAAARFLVDLLRPDDRLNVILFNTALKRFAEAPRPVDDACRAELRAFIDGVEAAGGTALGDAVAAACAAPKEPGRVAMAVLLSDGLPTVGEKNPEEIVAFARDGRQRGLRAYTFGVGDDVDGALLEAVASAGGGQAHLFRVGSEVESRLRTFLLRTASPAIADLRLEIAGRSVDDVHPRALPEVYLGEQAMITGRVPCEGTQSVVVNGVLEGRPISLATTADFGKPGAALGAGDPVARDLYAMAALSYLERATRLRGKLNDAAYYAALDRGAYSTQDELVAAQIELSLDSGIACSYTSFLAMLPEDRRRLQRADAAALEAALRRVAERKRELAGSPSTGAKDPAGLEDPALSEDFFPDEPPAEAAAGAPFDARNLNDVIGAGGGSGGGFGGKYGRRGGARGGGSASQRAVDAGLDWLARHQDPQGFWDCDDHGRHCTTKSVDGCGAAELDLEVTAQALLAFLGAGHTSETGAHRPVVKRALRWLMRQQDRESGRFGAAEGPRSLCAHARATQAMAEAYQMSGIPLLRLPAERAVGQLLAARRPGGAWGAEPGREDLDTTSAVMFALFAAEDAGLEVDDAALDAGLAFVERMTDPATGRTGDRVRGAPTRREAADAVRWPAEHSELATAQACLLRSFAGRTVADSPAQKAGVDLLCRSLPRWDVRQGTIDYEYWNIGSFAMWQASGRYWDVWQKALLPAVVQSQRTGEDCLRGSWDPEVDPFGRVGGRVDTTATNVLTLEVYYRYR